MPARASASPAPFEARAEPANSYWQIGNLWSILASAESTGGAFSALEQLMPQRSGPPLHRHERWHEFFYLLDGKIRFQVAEQLLDGATGSFVSIPPGVAHSFTVLTHTARVLNMYTPGGFEAQIQFTATSATELSLPPADLTPGPSAEGRRAFIQASVELNSQSPVSGVADLLKDQRTPLPIKEGD